MVIILKSIIIHKPCELKGSIKISGSKNAALPILCTSLLAKDTVYLHQVPKIADIDKMITIMRYLNCKVKRRKNTLKIQSKNIRYKPLTIPEFSQIRGSYYFIPVLLYLFKRCEISLPGGCKIGQRPIDAHLKAFEAMGYAIRQEKEYLIIEQKEKIKKIHYTMSKVSVGASINAILCSLGSEYAVIDNVLLEPEGLSVVAFLNQLGYRVLTLNQRCVFKGYEPNFKKYEFRIIPDRIEAMTFVLMGLLCGKIKVKNVVVNHIRYPLDCLSKANYKVKVKKNSIKAYRSRGNSFDIKTEVYPFFPTDMQSIFGVLLAHSRGNCVIEETIFENRMQIYKDMIDLGAGINLIGNKAYIIGEEGLQSGTIVCTDLRQSAAAVLYVLKNGGRAENVELIERGYEKFWKKIKSLGAKFSIK